MSRATLVSYGLSQLSPAAYCRSTQHAEAAPEQVQAQALQTQLSPHELAYQESLIQEREAEIREIETGIHELSEIFRDLGTLVHEQGGMLGQFHSTLCNLRLCLMQICGCRSNR